MRIRVLRNLGRDLPRYTEGQVVDVGQTEGESLCGRGLAEPVVQAVPQEPMAAVPPAPAIGKAKSKSKGDD